MRLCIGNTKSVYCCTSACSSKVDGYSGTHEGVCYARAARMSYSVQASEKASSLMLQRVPRIWFDTSASITFVAHPEVVLSLMSALASTDPYAQVYGQIQVGEFAVPKVIRVVGLTDDCYLLFDDKMIVRSVSIGQRGGDLIEMTLQAVKYSGAL